MLLFISIFIFALHTMLFLPMDIVGKISTCIGLVCIAWIIYALIISSTEYNTENKGGFRKSFIDFLGLYARKQFVECSPHDSGSIEFRYGYKLFKHRFLYFALPLEKIESVEWSAGQATSMAGRDMNDWIVFIWFDHDDPEKSLKRQTSRKPDQDLYCIGPSVSKDIAAVFGQSLVDFLNRAGATFVRKEFCSFVRSTSKTIIEDEKR
jgi:hypothetical protein